MRVSISVSDPWDFGEEIGWKPLVGRLVKIVDDDQGGKALIMLDDVVTYRGAPWRYLIARIRHQGDQISALQSGKAVLGSIYGIPEDQASSAQAMDTDQRPGGLRFIGDIDPCS